MTMKKITALLSISALLIITLACAGVTNLRTTHVSSTNSLMGTLTGKCDLILYTALEDEIELRVAVLDLVSDNYRLEPSAGPANYKRLKGLHVEDALKQAEAFLSSLEGFDKIETRKVTGPGGGIVAFEVRPLYEPFLFGSIDITDTNYYIKENGIVSFVVRTSLPKRMGLQGLQKR